MERKIENSLVLVVNPFSTYAAKIVALPTEIQNYLDAEKKEDDRNEGTHFTILREKRSEDPGIDGMRYFNRIKIFAGGQEKPVYDSGDIMYISGKKFSKDRDDLCFYDFRIISETAENLIYGYRHGIGMVMVKECTNAGKIKLLAEFNLKVYEAAVQNQNEPTDDQTFEEWVKRHLGNDDYINVDDYHSDESLCVVLARHASRTFDASHNWYKIFVWKKGEGLAKSETQFTGAYESTIKYQTNYLRCNVSVTGENEILLEAKSQMGDVKITQRITLESKAVKAA